MLPLKTVGTEFFCFTLNQFDREDFLPQDALATPRSQPPYLRGKYQGSKNPFHPNVHHCSPSVPSQISNTEESTASILGHHCNFSIFFFFYLYYIIGHKVPVKQQLFFHSLNTSHPLKRQNSVNGMPWGFSFSFLFN